MEDEKSKDGRIDSALMLLLEMDTLLGSICTLSLVGYAELHGLEDPRISPTSPRETFDKARDTVFEYMESRDKLIRLIGEWNVGG